MKYILILLGLLLAGGLYWYFSTPPTIDDAAVPTTTPTDTEQTVETDTVEYEIDPADFVDSSTLLPDKGGVSLSPAEVAGLLLMREEEKLARDVYEALGEAWGMPMFSNIARSEQTHMDAMGALLALYEIPDPVATDTRGVFTDTQMQTLYDELTAQGLTSLEEALVVGATIEELDIKDLADLMAETNNEQILSVYRNLQKGSRNHLRAFDRQMQQRNVDFVPQYITQAEYDAIISAPQERGQI